MNPLQQLDACGQSPWVDHLRRAFIVGGGLKKLVEQDGVKGVTSNPSIFEKAIVETDEYAKSISDFQTLADHDVSTIYERLAIADIQGPLEGRALTTGSAVSSARARKPPSPGPSKLTRAKCPEARIEDLRLECSAGALTAPSGLFVVLRHAPRRAPETTQAKSNPRRR